MAEFSDSDIFYMQEALELGRAGLGRVAPNPSVGCVIVRDAVIVGRGRTADGGRPHAEIVALTEAGDLAQGADVYVTLEPCSHHGKSGPCAEALIVAGVRRVVVACGDPNPMVAGQGLVILKEAGIKVDFLLCEAEALESHKGFLLTLSDSRPLVTLKMAVSSDGKIAGENRAQIQISGESSHGHMHRKLRATHDAILVGMGTVIADNPRLSTRVEGVEHDSLRVILGRSNDLPKGSHLHDSDGVVVIEERNVDTALQILVETHGVTRLLVEGGAAVMQIFLTSDLWDRLYLYRSPMVVGAGGLDAPEFGHLDLIAREDIGEDVLEIYQPKA